MPTITFNHRSPRTLCLLIGLLIAAPWKYFRLISERDYSKCFSVIPWTDKDQLRVKRLLFDDYLPTAIQLRAGKQPSPKCAVEADFVWYDDPRPVIWFLWQDLTPSEREYALRSLGYDTTATSTRLLRGPHPTWFAKFDSLWQSPCF